MLKEKHSSIHEDKPAGSLMMRAGFIPVIFVSIGLFWEFESCQLSERWNMSLWLFLLRSGWFCLYQERAPVCYKDGRGCSSCFYHRRHQLHLEPDRKARFAWLNHESYPMNRATSYAAGGSGGIYSEGFSRLPRLASFHQLLLFLM